MKPQTREADITKGKYHDYDTFLGAEAANYLRLYLDQRRKGTTGLRGGGGMAFRGQRKGSNGTLPGAGARLAAQGQAREYPYDGKRPIAVQKEGG